MNGPAGPRASQDWSLRAVLLYLLAACSTACGSGAYLSPTAYAPMMSRKEEMRLNAGVRADPRRGMYLKGVIAATKQLRVGVQLAGAHLSKSGISFDEPEATRLRTMYGEGAFGFELPRGRWMGGVMGFVGYGGTDAVQALCYASGRNDCAVPYEPQQYRGQYSRLGAQGHVGFRLGLRFHLALGFGPAWVRMHAQEIDFVPTAQRDDLVALEPFAVFRVESRNFSFEVQPRASFLVGTATDQEGDSLVTAPRFFMVFSLGLHTPPPAPLPPRRSLDD
jgi:hypothetical protein